MVIACHEGDPRYPSLFRESIQAQLLKETTSKRQPKETPPYFSKSSTTTSGIRATPPFYSSHMELHEDNRRQRGISEDGRGMGLLGQRALGLTARHPFVIGVIGPVVS